MSQNNLLAKQEINQNIFELADFIEKKRVEGCENEIEDVAMQKLMENLIRLYVAKVEKSEGYEPYHSIRPIPAEVQLTQTETAVFVDQLIKRLEIEVFELQMWRSMK